MGSPMYSVTEDEKFLRNVAREFEEGFNSGDVGRIMRFYGDTYVDVNLRNPVQTRAERREYYQNVMARPGIHVNVRPDDIVVRGDLAFVRGTLLLTQNAGSGAEAARTELRYLEICERAADGTWRVLWGMDGPVQEYVAGSQVGRRNGGRNGDGETMRAEMVTHNEMLKGQLREGIADPAHRAEVKQMVKSFNPRDYPKVVDGKNDEMACSVFGHYCPVFFVNEPLTETHDMRRIGRRIPRAIMLRVVRRDNNQCQLCGLVLKDNEIEFDHLIPLSKGGSSEEHNLRVACFDCNRSKSNQFEP
jgi:ketosteroid isomerase-like protein